MRSPLERGIDEFSRCAPSFLPLFLVLQLAALTESSSHFLSCLYLAYSLLPLRLCLSQQRFLYHLFVNLFPPLYLD